MVSLLLYDTTRHEPVFRDSIQSTSFSVSWKITEPSTTSSITGTRATGHTHPPTAKALCERKEENVQRHTFALFFDKKIPYGWENKPVARTIDFGELLFSVTLASYKLSRWITTCHQSDLITCTLDALLDQFREIMMSTDKHTAGTDDIVNCSGTPNGQDQRRYRTFC